MAVSKSRNVCGYVKRQQAIRRLTVEIQEAEAKLAERLAPKKAKYARLVDECNVLYGRMTGGQIAEARRLTAVRHVDNCNGQHVAQRCLVRS